MTLYEFHTDRFTIACTADYDLDHDLSWRDADQVAYDDAHGVEYYQFDVTVTYRGRIIGRSSLGGSGYSDPRTFVKEHRDPNPMNRNCTPMRAARGNVCICHYFPDMVREALAEARSFLAGACAVPLRALS